MKTQLVIAAAGMGVRLGRAQPKALVGLAGQPMIVRTLMRFESMGLVDRAIVVVPGDYQAVFEETLAEAYPAVSLVFVRGGAQRQESVRRGLTCLDPATDIAVIHDAARPFVPERAIRKVCVTAAGEGAATMAIPCSDTILEVDEENRLLDTPDRQRLWTCQTPQAFRVPVIQEAHERALRQGFAVTDDASLARWAGYEVRVVMGSPLNFKITKPEDLMLAERMLQGGWSCTE
ncbi:MAG TPA: 2-C-methyl-D-erythritol 4-phosphate cytidylyltransferase [Candidatus Hydrogenedentes bacterium]|nr:2-C-methyl-D-erythritol 4-phosphate cytidylyltransferase [Candidatus Hydrogenedentota bacterium]